MNYRGFVPFAVLKKHLTCQLLCSQKAFKEAEALIKVAYVPLLYAYEVSIINVSFTNQFKQYFNLAISDMG